MQLAMAGWDSSCCVGRANYVYDSCVCVCGQEFVMQLAVAGGDSNCCMGRSNNVYDTCLCVWQGFCDAVGRGWRGQHLLCVKSYLCL